MTLHPRVLESFPAFCDAFNISLFDHQRADFGAALRREDGRFVHRLAGISWPRGDGKSWAAAATGIWRLIAGRPPQHILSVALDLDGTKVVLAHARRIRRSHPDLERAIEVRANELLVPATGSRWTIGSREDTNSRGEHPDVAYYDEAGLAKDDELFASLLAGQASVADPLMLVTSTVGRRQSGPLWSIKRLSEEGAPGVFWTWNGENRSPKVSREFLHRQRRILMPAQFAREHQNLWVDAADSYTSAAEVDAAMGSGWREHLIGRRDVDSVVFVDLGTVRDPSVIALGYQEAGAVYLGRLLTFQGSQERPVQLTDVEHALRQLAVSWRVTKIRIESWQGVSAVQSLQRLGLPVELFHPTAKQHSEEWPVLAQRLATRSLVLFPHARLREELLNLVCEVGPHGVKVIDRGRIHQDHAVALRGVTAMLAMSAARRPATMFHALTGQAINPADARRRLWF